MNRPYHNGFTLMEMLVVVIIIGVFAVLSVSQFSSYRESALDSDAKQNLKLIRAAEQVYKMEITTYYPAAGTDSNMVTINANLKLSLPAGAAPNWAYTVRSDGCGIATRTAYGRTRSWSLIINSATGEPNPNGTCS